MKSLGAFNLKEIFVLDDIIFVVKLVVFVGGMLFFLFIGIQSIKGEIAAKKAPQEKTIKNDLDYEFTTTEVRATVVDMSCSTRVVGRKSVKSVEEFFVIFKTENDETIKLEVLKELYDAFEIGQTGILRLVDGELFGFEI